MVGIRLARLVPLFVGCVMIAIAVFMGVNSPTPPTDAQDDLGILNPSSNTYLAQDLLGKINGLRGSLGLLPLQTHPSLTAAAQEQANWIIATGSYAHIHPDGSSPTSRAAAAGYLTTDWCCSENTFIGSSLVMDGQWTFWNRSPAHYRNMIADRWREIGIGTATNGTSTSWVLVFGVASQPGPVTSASNLLTDTMAVEMSNTAPVVNGGIGGGAPVVAQPPAVVQPMINGTSYTVQYGDTLYHIARRNGLSVEALMTANRILGSRIMPGQTLVIPPAGATVETVLDAANANGGEQVHVVQRGETLDALARFYGVEMSAIVRANRLANPNRIKVGEALVIP